MGMVVGVSLGAVGGGATGVVLAGDVHPATRINAMQATTIIRVFDKGKCIFHCSIVGSYSFCLFSHAAPRRNTLWGIPVTEGFSAIGASPRSKRFQQDKWFFLSYWFDSPRLD